MKNNIFIRYAELSDSKDIYNWEFHPSSRKWMRNKNVISFEKHQLWLKNYLKKVDSKLFICQNKDLEKIGIVRVDKNDKTNEISIGITIDPLKRGKGFASECLHKVIEYVSLNLWINRTFIAEIMNNNIASLRTFEKVGFKFFGESDNFYIYKKGKNIYRNF